MTDSRPLDGLSVLVLEDSYYIAEESQQTLEEAGARVLGPCRDMAEVRTWMERGHPDCALVDINLGDGPTFEPARELLAAGVPIILVTGYDRAIVPADLHDKPCLEKPVAAQRLVSGVASACHR